MSTGLLIITHDQIGDALLATATTMIGCSPLATRTMAVSADSDPEQLAREARSLARELNQGDGVLILTDMFGSTPSNVAALLLDQPGMAVVAGVNLPMLIRVLNYAHLGLPELAHKATSGGQDGIIWNSSSARP